MLKHNYDKRGTFKIYRIFFGDFWGTFAIASKLLLLKTLRRLNSPPGYVAFSAAMMTGSGTSYC